MNFARFILVAIGQFLLVCPLPAQTKPNIIFVLVDDMGWGDLGVFYQNGRNFPTNRNAPALMTPHLDAMAAEGMQLRRHYAPAPVCAPSRASLLLGVHQGHANVRDNSFDKALENNHTLGTVLKQAGYATAMIGKYGLQGSGLPAPARPEVRGFDYFFGYLEHGDAHYHYPKETGANIYDGTTEITAALDKCYSTDLIAARSKKWIMTHRAASTTQPFFLYLAFTAPHARLDVPTMAYPAGFGMAQGIQWNGTAGSMINTASGSINSFIHPDYANATYDHDSSASTAEVAWPDYAKRHATMIRRLDDAMADLIQTLKDLGIDDNTLIVFTSDNGPHNEAGSGGSYTYNPTFFDSFGPLDGIKRDTWEGGIREPALVRWPGHIPAGSISQTPSQFHDWMPTFTELAGLPAPARSDGVSLIPTLTATGTQRPGTVYVEYNYSGSTPTYTEFESSRRGATRNQEQIIHLEGYKGIRYNIASSTDNFRIYDTLGDAKEMTDLASSGAYFTGLQQRMKDRVLQVRRPGGGVGRPYDATNIPPVTPGSTIAGLDYAAFEGSFPWVPDFTSLTPVASGTTPDINLGLRTRPDNIGLRYTGYLSVPTDGSYTIYLTTESRAFLRLHDASVIDADFSYVGGTEISGVVNLQAGRHPLCLSYVRGTGGVANLSLQWSGPGIAKQEIPAANLQRLGTTPPLPPTANPDAGTTNGGVAVMLTVLANDSDDGNPSPLAISSVTQPENGVAVITGNNITYTPRTGFFGDDTFSYTITDGQDQATSSVTVRVNRPVGNSLWLPFDEMNGTPAFDAGGASIATLQNFSDTARSTGAQVRALNFDGVDDTVVVSSVYVPPLGAAPRTFLAWLKPAATQTEFGAWLGYGTNANGNRITLRLESGRLRCEVQGGFAIGTKLLSDGAWHHAAIIVSDANSNGTTDINEVRLFVDGIIDPLSSTAARAINTLAGAPLTIGGSNHASSYDFTGSIDEVRIIPSALTAADVASLFTRNATADAWFYRYYGNAAPTSTDWNGDLDGDGFDALLEFGLGGNPTASSPQIAPLLIGTTQFRFNRRKDGLAPGSFSPEISGNLTTWTPLTDISSVPHPELSGFDLATATLPVSPATPRFLRLKITGP